MKAIINTVLLKDLRTDEYREANLFQGIDVDTLKGIQKEWAPEFEAAGADVRPEDAHWDWVRKSLAAMKNPFVYEIFGIDIDEQTQGMMLAAKGGVNSFSRHQDHLRKPLVYVDFLATAPWNRPLLTPRPKFKGVGRMLIATAISLSYEEEFDGRIGLHSLPGAERFYREIMKMHDFGGDPDYHNLRYFELTQAMAKELTGYEPPKKKGG